MGDSLHLASGASARTKDWRAGGKTPHMFIPAEEFRLRRRTQTQKIERALLFGDEKPQLWKGVMHEGPTDGASAIWRVRHRPGVEEENSGEENNRKKENAGRVLNH